jgi:hypothetical protein
MRLGVYIFVAASLMLSACQTPQNTANKALNSSTNAALQSSGATGTTSSKYFDAEMRKDSHDLQLSLIKSCARSQTSIELDTCFRQTIVAGFDESGTGRIACARITEIQKFGECISLGNFATSLRELIPQTKQPPMATTDWLNPKPYLDRLGVSFGLSVASLCLESGATDTLACARNEITKRVLVADTYQSRCKSLPEIHEFSRCLGEAYGLKLMEDGIGRIATKTGAS